MERTQIGRRFFTGGFESDQLGVDFIFRQSPGFGTDENLMNAIRLADRYSRRNT